MTYSFEWCSNIYLGHPVGNIVDQWVISKAEQDVIKCQLHEADEEDEDEDKKEKKEKCVKDPEKYPGYLGFLLSHTSYWWPMLAP